MNGCIYRTKDGECELWEKDRNHSPFCNPNCDHKHPSNADRIRGMTDEELADWLFQAWHNSWYTLQEWLDWLKDEAK